MNTGGNLEKATKNHVSGERTPGATKCPGLRHTQRIPLRRPLEKCVIQEEDIAKDYGICLKGLFEENRNSSSIV